MSETLTYDPGTDTVTTEDSLTPDEQESLAVGEEMQNQQESLLAGKYKNAEELEKAYVELSKKLGQDGKEETPEAKADDESEEVLQETPEEKPTEISPAAELITSANDEFFSNDGKLSPETLDKFASMSSKQLVEAYMEVQGNLTQDSPQQVADIPDSAVNEIKNYAGGEQAYQNMINWAQGNLDKQSVQAFDNIVDSGSVQAIKLAVNGLKQQYEEAVGYEGKMYTGKAPSSTKDVYRSQAELVSAMSDPRYDNDPAYRQDVIAKLERSDNLTF